MSKTERRPLTADELACAERLKAIYEDRKRNHGLTQEKLGDTIGISQSAITQYMNGRIPMNLPVKFGFAAALSCHPSDIDTSLTFFAPLRPDEQKVLDDYRNSNPDGKELIAGAAAIGRTYAKLGLPAPKAPSAQEKSGTGSR